MGIAELNLIDLSQLVFSSISAFIAAIAVIVGVVSAYRARSGTSNEGGITAAEVSEIERPGRISAKPFEIPALANYYNQALNRAHISFWFSIVFASIGFGVIIFAFLSYTAADLAGTIVKVTSGAIIDAVSGLFFVQSSNAQKSMSDFFEKLRLDRLNAEAREMISEVENEERRDQLRAQLILKYTGIDKLVVGS